DSKGRANPKGRALNHGDAFGLQKLGDEILVGVDPVPRRGGLAHGPGARGINVERSFRLRAFYALRLVEHGDAEVAAFLEDLIVLWNKVLRTVECFDGRPL